ncbi:MAG: ASPIC/UnbV domain-containing protein, partial [Bacteroidota bacterium]
EAALAYRLDNKGAGMGVAIGDCNNDGLFDIYITNIFTHLPNPLFVDQGNRRYKDVASAWGVNNTGWGWGTQFLDFDHDGDEDLAAVNGPIDKVSQVPQPDIANFFFKNLFKQGESRFDDWSKQSGTDGLAKGKGLEAFDYDGDGDLDMVVANMLENAYFFRNETIHNNEQPADKNWLQIKLEGVVSNRNAFGTTVKIRIGNEWMYRYNHGGAIFGQSIKPVHFGVGSATMIDEIRFTWLTGVTEAIYNVPVNQILSFKEGSGRVVVEENNPQNGGSTLVEKHFAQPNPFARTTTLNFQIAKPGTVDLRIFNAMGQEIYHDSQILEEAGTLSFDWDGSGQNPGVYLYTATFGDKQMTGKMVMVNKP